MANLLQIPDVQEVDSRLLVNSVKKLVISKGASNCTVQKQTSSSLSNNQIVYNVVLGNAASTVIDPLMYMQSTVRVTLGATGLTGGQLVEDYVENHFAPRALPFNSIIATCQVQVNNMIISSQPAQYVHQLSWFQDLQHQALIQSTTPIYPDQSPVYADLVGSIKSPLNSYAVGSVEYAEPRGSFMQNVTTITSTTGTWVFDINFSEALYSPFLSYDASSYREGLAYVNLLNITLNMIGNINRMFSLDAVTCPNITSLSCEILSSQLSMTWLTAPEVVALPSLVLKSFNNIITNQTNQIAFTPGQQMVVQSQSYSLSQIPKYLYVYCSRANYDIATGYTQSDFCFSIQALTILFNNKSGLMSTFNAFDLYTACCAEEGSNMTYTQSQHDTGSILCLDPVKLFGLGLDQSAGLIGTFQLQIQATVTNISSESITPNLWVLFSQDTYFTTDVGGTSNLIQGVINNENVLATNSLPAVPTSFSSHDDIFGGSFLDKIKSFGSKALQFIRDQKLLSRSVPTLTGLLAPQFLPQAAIASNLLSNYGVGRRPSGRGRTSKRQLMDQRRSAIHY